MKALNQKHSILGMYLVGLTPAGSPAIAPTGTKIPEGLMQQGLRGKRFLTFHSLMAGLLMFVLGTWALPATGEELILATTEDVLQFHLVEGKGNWAWVERQRILGALWLFSPDGTFLYRKPDVPNGVFPIAGTFQVSEEALLFRGSKTLQGLGASIQGQVLFNDGQWVLHIVESSEVEGRAETKSMASPRRMTWSVAILLQTTTISSEKLQAPGGLSYLSWGFSEHREG